MVQLTEEHMRRAITVTMKEQTVKARQGLEQLCG